jgi:hypothetical protein
MIVDFMDCVLQDLPSLIGVFRIHHHPVLKRIYLEIPLLLIAHFLPVSPFPIPKFKPLNPDRNNPNNVVDY